MKFARFAVSLCIASAFGLVSAAPTVLILQSKVSLKNKKDTSDPNVDIAEFIAHELDQEGKVIPIVYSMADATFRGAATSGKLKDPPDNPKGREVFEVARQLGADYVVIVEAGRAGGSVHAKLRLYREGRQVWKDEENMGVGTNNNVDSDTTGRSIARTFVLRLDTTPFRGYPDRPKTQTPTLQPGQAPVVSAPVVPVVHTDVDDGQLAKQVDTLLEAHKTDDATLLMRDAVDRAPFDLNRRLELVKVLQATNPIEAAEEARRAAILMPEKVDLRVMAARAWMAAGHPDEAQKDLNEAIARDPNGASTRMLLAELSLEQLDPVKALAHLDEAIKQQDSAQARFQRAVCRALLGGIDGMQIDLLQLAKIEPVQTTPEITERYAMAASLTDRWLARDGADVRVLLPKIVVRPKDRALAEQIDGDLRLLQSRTALLSSIAVPADAKQSNDLRLLAQKLMAQCLMDLQSYSANGDEDTLADARINLGEALKKLAATHPAG